jgi:hypothetical protein
VFKKAFQIVFTFSLLTGGFLAYSRTFSLLVAWVGVAGDPEAMPFPEVDAKSALRAAELARESFGPDHWTAQRDLQLRYYEAAHGYYMYTQNYKRLNNGTRLEVTPFCMIWESKDRKSRKIATSKSAIIDLSQPFGLINPSGAPSRVVHAQLLGDVSLRDDKGTRDDPEDDLVVSKLTHIEYDEKTLQITTDSDLVIQDRDLIASGTQMMIQLRRKPGVVTGSATGFDAEAAHIYKNVEVLVKNVGSGGILPGTAKPEKGGRTPLVLTCDGVWDMELPGPKPDLPGPPNPFRKPDPTIAKFHVNVKVVRGTAKKDQLDCDTLRLVFEPKPKVATDADQWEYDYGPEEDADASGTVTELAMREALAQGHAVWLQSESQGLRARCVELKYEKHLPLARDKTYLNGGTTKKLFVENVEYRTPGDELSPIKTVRTLYAQDATIFDGGPGGLSTVIARGPGRSEERPARNASVARTAWFEDEMNLETWRDTPQAPTRRLLTLTGVSKLVDHLSSQTLDARKSIVAEFEAGPRTVLNGPEGPTRIKRLQAFEDAHLTAPYKTLVARKQFEARFEDPPLVPVSTLPAPPSGTVAAAPVTVPAGTLAANTGEPETPVVEEPKPTPVEPAVDARANYVWATLVTLPNNKNELKNAQLRVGVMVHQDPAPGKPSGTDATGEALDLTTLGAGLMKLAVAAEDPQATGQGRTRLVASGGNVKPPVALARVDFEGKTIEAPLVGLDQKADFAWARGAGNLRQMAQRGLLDDKGLGGPTTKDGKVASTDTQEPFVIFWNEEMKFFGNSRDLQGRPAAKAEFRGVSRKVRTLDGAVVFRRGVEAKMTDSAIYCDTMDAYFDRPIALNRKSPSAEPDDPNKPKEPPAEVAMLDCRGQTKATDGMLEYAGVDITSQKLYSNVTKLREKQRIQSEHVIYDKRTGDFEAPGPGMVYLYKRKDSVTAKANAEAGPALIPVSASRTNGSKKDDVPAPRIVPPLELTQVWFNEGMRGKFGVARDKTEQETRKAEFVGNVQAYDALVRDGYKSIDPDHPPLDALSLSSDVLRVWTEPPQTAETPARQFLFAQGNAVSRTVDRTIQADRITFNSGTDLVYAYGDGGKEISMVEQKNPGTPPSKVVGNAGWYNKTTKEGKIINPQSIQMYDLGSGVRPKPFYPDLGGSGNQGPPLKPQRTPFPRVQRNNTERNGFTGH